ncbi:DUF4157 domain-containing protein [Sphingomonas sp.]|uniref:eCIS core domain-containing protein n=1 Tax=Sphingomonas sp. TaxID=28214 RepID=UPI003D6CFF55
MGYAAPIRKAAATPAPAAAPARPRARPASTGSGARSGAGILQAKFALGPRADAFEREADSAAAHVVGGQAGVPSLSPLFASTALTQRACAACQLGDDDTHGAIQRKCAGCGGSGGSCGCNDKKQEEDPHPELQIDRAAKRSSDGDGSALRAVESVIATPGRPLPNAVRGDMEQGFGRDFSQVRVHDSPRAAASAEGIGAHAYTVGNHIAFNQGQFRPDTSSGRFLLAHELAHTVQQAGAPSARPDRISRPADRHEGEAHRAAHAAVSGGPMPALTAGAAPVSRYSFDDFANDVSDVGGAVVDGVVDAGGAVVDGVVDVGGAVVDGVVDVADAVADAISAMWDTAIQIASAIGGAVSLDGTTIVIDVPQFEPCPEFEFQFSLSDIGIEPSFYFPIVAGALTIGVLDVIGTAGIEVTVDPGIGFRLEGCSFGPAQIRIDPLSASTTVMGAASITTASEVSLGADLALKAQLVGVLTIPFEPPIILIAPVVGIAAGGTMALMLQQRDIIDHYFSVTMGLGGFSEYSHTYAEIGYGLDFAYGLFGAVDIMGLNICRVGWPLGSLHEQIAAGLTLDTAMSVGTGGIGFSFSASAVPLAHNPLDDLSFAFDQSRLEDDCPLCDFFTSNNLMPGQNGYNWAAHEPTLPRWGGPLSGIYVRNPGIASGASCRGTCGVDCPPEPTCDAPYDRTVCEDVGDRHVWHVYRGYATCGTARGCRDHDACYDFAAMEPIWGFGGYLIGPMYRACDLEAMCGYTFKQAVTWAMGGGPFDEDRMAYADQHDVLPGCLGPCPQNTAAAGEPEVQETCLDDRELWPGVQTEDHWEKHFGNWRLIQGFAEVPWIGGVHYGVDAQADGRIDVFGELGPLNLENACLTYDAAGRLYTGSAELALHYYIGGSAMIRAALDGWLADLFCLAQWVTLRGTLSALATIGMPGNVRARVTLECVNGELRVIPDLSLTTCLDVSGEIIAALDFFLLNVNVWSQEWPLFHKEIERCWQIGLEFDPFIVGEQPNFRMDSSWLDINDLLFDLFDPAQVRDVDRGSRRNPLPDPSVLLPCLRGGDDPPPVPDDDQNCPTRATGADARRLKTNPERLPRFGPVSNLTITAGASANVASWMEAPFLSTPHPPGSPTRDAVQRGIYRQPGLPTQGCVRSGSKKSQVYAKGHLLNENVGGLAEEFNLFPITEEANKAHERQVEQGGQRVVPRVEVGDEVLYYKVTVQDVSAPQEIMRRDGTGTNLFEISSTLHCEVADYQLCSNDTLRRNPIQTVDVPSVFRFHPSGGRPFDDVMKPCPRT